MIERPAISYDTTQLFLTKQNDLKVILLTPVKLMYDIIGDKTVAAEGISGLGGKRNRGAP